VEPRLHYTHLAPEGFAALRGLEHYLNTAAGLDAKLQEFARLLASLLNGCEYCIHLHTAELKKHNETEARIEEVRDWRSSSVYTERERAALAWTEAVTDIQQGHAPDAVYNNLRAHFSEAEIVNLTLTIATINAWNRIAIALGSHSSRG
jgi:AhpD family alkylhydroperoxidase